MDESIRNLLEAAGKILVDRKQEKQSGKCFNCVDICHAVLQQKNGCSFPESEN